MKTKVTLKEEIELNAHSDVRGFYHERIHQRSALSHPHYNFPRYLVWSAANETNHVTIQISPGLGSIEGFPSEKRPLKSSEWNKKRLSYLANNGASLSSTFPNLPYLAGNIIELFESQEIDERDFDWDPILDCGYHFANEQCIHDACYAHTTLDNSLTELMEKLRAQSNLASCVYDNYRPFRLIDNKLHEYLSVSIWFENEQEHLSRSLRIFVPGKSTILMYGEKIVAGRFPFGSGFFEAGTAEVGTDVAIETLKRIANSAPFYSNPLTLRDNLTAD